MVGKLAPRCTRGYKTKAFCWDRQGKQSPEGNGDIQRIGISVRAPSGTNRLGFYLPRLYRNLDRALQHEEFDVIHCTHFILLPFAIRLASVRGAKVVYDAYEFYALDVSDRLGPLSRPARMVLEWLEDCLVARVDGVITIDSRGGRLAHRYETRCSNVEVLFNVPDLSIRPDRDVTRQLAAQYEGYSVLVYMGGIYGSKGADQFVRVLSQIKRERPNIRLLLLGEFQDDSLAWLTAEAAQAGMRENLEFLGWVSYSQLLSYLAIAHVGLALYQPSEPRFWEVGRGNSRKVFDYMRSGLPITGPAFSDAGALITEEGCGYAVDTSDADAVAKKVLYLLKHPEEARAMGERGRRAVLERYNWELEQHKVLRLYNRIGVLASEE